MKRFLVLPLLAAVALAGFLSGCNRGMEEREQAQVRELALRKYQLGLHFTQAGDDLMALESFTHSVVISPTAAAYYELGQTYERLDEVNAAMDAYENALELAPDFQEAKFAKLALEHAQPEPGEEVDTGLQAEREEMQERLARAQEIRKPTLNEVRELLFSQAASAEELPSAANPAYEPDQEIMLGTYTFHYGNGVRLMNARSYDRAALEFERAVEADPTKLDARLNLGDVLLQMDRPQQALRQYEVAREMFPDSPRPVLKLGNYYGRVNQPGQARDLYGQALFMDPNYAEALNNMAALEIQENDLQAAIKLLQDAIAIDPDYALAWLNLGVARENTGDTQGALEAYRRYVAMGGERSEEVAVWIAELE